MKRFIRIIPHITIILSLMFLTFWILDQYNPMMNFLNSNLSKLLLLIFCISSFITAIIAVVLDRKRKPHLQI
jgi:hypothetical protein